MEQLQELVSKLQGYIQLDTLDKIVTSYKDLSEEDKGSVMATMQYWVKKVELLNEYEANRTKVIKKGLDEMNTIENKVKENYKVAVEKIEKEEDTAANKEADELIKQI